MRPASKTVVFCSVPDHQPLEDSHVRGGNQDFSHLPPKGAQSPYQCRFGRAVAFSGQAWCGKMSAAAGVSFWSRASFVSRSQQRRCLRACGAPAARPWGLCALFAVCFRWGLGAFLFRSSHVEILSSHDARYTAVAHLPPARLGGVSSLDPLGSAASRLAPLPLRQPPLLPAPPLLVSCLAAPHWRRGISRLARVLPCTLSRHSSCVVRV